MATSTLPAISFRDLLVAYDFSDTSERALEYAKAIARRHASRLLLVHVMESQMVVASDTEWIQPNPAQIAERVEAAGLELREGGFTAESLNPFGAVADQVRQLAKTREVDLILAGTHAGEGLDRAFFGSNAEKLARSIDCPVMLIGPKCRKAPESWEPQRVLVATRLYPQRANIAVYGAKLARMNRAEFLILHVAHPGQNQERAAWNAFLEEMTRLSSQVSVGEPERKTIVSRNHASADILSFAGKWQADLIVTGASRESMGVTHFRRGALGEILAEAECPVLAMRH